MRQHIVSSDNGIGSRPSTDGISKEILSGFLGHFRNVSSARHTFGKQKKTVTYLLATTIIGQIFYCLNYLLFNIQIN